MGGILRFLRRKGRCMTELLHLRLGYPPLSSPPDNAAPDALDTMRKRWNGYEGQGFCYIMGTANCGKSGGAASAKVKTTYAWQEFGYASPIWMGRCPGCGS